MVVLDVINAQMSKHVSSGACILGEGGISAAAAEVLAGGAAAECSQMPRIFLIHQALSP